MAKRRQSVLVVGLDDGPEASWGPFVLACLPSDRFRRVGAVLSHAESGAYRGDLVDSVHRVASPGEDPKAFAAGILRIAKSERVRLVLPGSLRAMDGLAAASKALGAARVRAIVPTSERLGRITIRRLVEACRKKRLPCSRTVELPSGVSYEAVPFDLRYPLTVVADGGRVVHASDRSHLVSIAHERPGRLLAVDRDPTQTFEAALVCDGAGRVRSSAAVRVIASDSRGRPWMAVTVDDPALLEAAAKAARALGASGPIVLTFEGGGATAGRPRGKSGYLAGEVRPGFPMWVEGAHAAGVPLVLDALRPERAKGGGPRARLRRPKAGVLFSQTAEDLPIDLLQPVRLARAADR